jgi:HSP20 family protein
MSAQRRSHNHDNDDLSALFPTAGAADARHDRWLEHHQDGRLAVDVFETDKELVVRAPIAGVKPENLEVFAHNDMLTIRGTRHEHAPEQRDASYLVRECHWGSFSRSVILPTEVDTDAISASLKDGVLTVTMPKATRAKKISVRHKP